MFKSLLFLGALAPSMLSGNVPTRLLENLPTFQVGDVYRLDVTCEVGSLSDNSYYLEGQNDVVSFSIDVNSFVIQFNDDVSCSYSYVFDSYISDFSYIQFATYLNSSTLPGSFLYFENYDTGFTNYYVIQSPHSSFSFSYSIEFSILDTDFLFSSSVSQYLTKVETPYTPPTKSNLYRLLYDFYYSLFNDDDLSSITTSTNLPFDSWLCHSLTIITLIGLVFILFLLLRWLFKVISGLILLKQ